MPSYGIIHLGPDGHGFSARSPRPRHVKRPLAKRVWTRTSVSLCSLIVLWCLVLPIFPYNRMHREPGGAAYYAWEAVYNNRNYYETPVGWTRVPTVYYTLQTCIGWAMMVMRRDVAELFTCLPEGKAP